MDVKLQRDLAKELGLTQAQYEGLVKYDLARMARAGERIEVIAQLLEEVFPAVRQCEVTRGELHRDALEHRAVDLGRVVASGAVEQVVCFVDDEDAVVPTVIVPERAETDVGVEDVVVVADDDVGGVDELERDLEWTNLRVARALEDDVRIELDRCRLGREVDRGLDHAVRLRQRLLHYVHARRAGHAAYV